MRCVITGAAVVLPGVGDPGRLFTSGPNGAAPVQTAPLIGGKGLRYKDRATQLAYCAAQSALRDSGLLRDDALTVPAATVGVVASSNFGNVDTVCQTMTTIADKTASETRPMDLPNASSNVVASSIAIRFGLRGPNLMVCNGATSGLDAVYLAALMLAAHRVPRILVVGVEPDNPEVREIAGGQTLDGAAAFLLEDPVEAARRGASVRAEVSGYRRAEELEALLEDMARPDLGWPALWQLPEGGAAVSTDLLSGVPRHDLSQSWGITSGALGVLQCTAAVGWFGRGGAGPVYAVAGDPVGGPVAGVVLSAPDPQQASATEDGTHAEPDAPMRLLRANALPDAGNGRMLLLHGLGNSATAWNQFVAEHRGGYEIWSADLPWRGDGQAAWCYHRDPREWLAQAVESIPPPLDVVVAHSFSANTLLHWLDAEFARGNDPLAGPGAPRGLILVSPFFRDSPQDFDWASLTDSAENFPRLAAEGIQAHLRATNGRELAEPLTQELARACCERVGPYTWARFFASYLATPWLRTSLIRVPCLVVAGEHDTVSPPTEAAALAARLPHADLRVLPGCGHFAMIDQSRNFARAIDEFVASLPPSTRF
jgi:3-oxoacyl-[acyl-carrier-protein] synthase II